MAYPSRTLVPSFRSQMDYWDPWDTQAMMMAMPQMYRRQGRGQFMDLVNQTSGGEGAIEVKNDEKEFKINLDVSQFAPNELTVKAIEDRCIVVEGKHEERKDEHGFVSRSFSRKYVLPPDCEASKLSSSLGPDGVLTVSAPKKGYIQIQANERVLPISMDSAPKPMSPQPIPQQASAAAAATAATPPPPPQPGKP